ncbi:hypothetical protein ACQ4LE_007487 [Meloidogyne hapla]|uniref:Uncharacterized protein n=1 Tax=Meloidogyne hapla TaxID=6305 RepID=A0A1I8B5F3_MELHA
MSSGFGQQQFYVPSTNVVTEIIIPTIIFCIGMVIAMIVGINKCKQWELDNFGEIRRTRRVIQRLTNRLRERNFKAIQRARDIRKRNLAVKKEGKQTIIPPPIYGNVILNNLITSGRSPPPAYEDSLLDEIYREIIELDEKI